MQPQWASQQINDVLIKASLTETLSNRNPSSHLQKKQQETGRRISSREMGDSDRKLNYDCGQQENRSLKKSSLGRRKLEVVKKPKWYPKRGGKDQTELPVARAAKGKTLFRSTGQASGRNQQRTISQRNPHYTLKASHTFTPRSAQNEWLQAARTLETTNPILKVSCWL